MCVVEVQILHRAGLPFDFGDSHLAQLISRVWQRHVERHLALRAGEYPLARVVADHRIDHHQAVGRPCLQGVFTLEVGHCACGLVLDVDGGKFDRCSIAVGHHPGDCHIVLRQQVWCAAPCDDDGHHEADYCRAQRGCSLCAVAHISINAESAFSVCRPAKLCAFSVSRSVFFNAGHRHGCRARMYII